MSVKVALVGLGHMGRLHLSKLLQMDDVEVVAVCDKEEQKRIEHPSIPFFTDPDGLVPLCDAVIIATPASTHYWLARQFIERERHVFVEKPLTIRCEEARELFEIARNKGVILKTGFIERFNPVIRRAISITRDPLLVDISRETPFAGRGTDVSVVMDLMIHDIDLSILLLGKNIRGLNSSGFPIVTEKADVAYAEILFENGRTLRLKASRVSPMRRRQVLIYEKERSFLFDLLEGRVLLRQKGHDHEEKMEKGDPLSNELRDFFSTIIRGVSEPVDENAILSIKIAEEVEDRIG